jgi:predicted lipoprotein with Yx(FWY)xxD motif
MNRSPEAGVSTIIPDKEHTTMDRTMTRPPSARTALLAGLLAMLLLAAGCSSKGYGTSAKSSTTSTAAASTTAGGGSDAYGRGGEAATTTTAATGAQTDLSLATTSLGPIVVDSAGRTLYRYEKDTGSTGTCVDACAKAWPPAAPSASPTKSAGITGAVTTSTRADGSMQLVLDGHPLYRYAADSATGDVNGQGVGGVWYAAKADGQKAG